MIFVFIAGMCFGFWVDERVTQPENVTQVNNGDNSTQIGIINNEQWGDIMYFDIWGDAKLHINAH